MAHCQKRSCYWEKASERGLALTWLEGFQCIPPNLLAAFMWRRPLNSIALAVTTHKGFEKVSDGTSTRVMDWTINKWRAKITWRELYNVRDLPKGRGHKICRENTVILRKVTVIKSKRNIFKNHSPWTLPRKNLYASHLSIYWSSLLSSHPYPIKGVVHFIEA